jgi:hypothetical protein
MKDSVLNAHYQSNLAKDLCRFPLYPRGQIALIIAI